MRHDVGVRIGSLTIVPKGVGATPGLRRFTRAHAIAAAGDAFITVSLAGSLFFSVSPDASRRQVLIYLVVTMAPFAVLAPLIGPTIDRFRRGHRWVAVIIYLSRALLCLALAAALFTLSFYVLALALLVANKASGVLKSALVPGLVDDTAHLVSANSRIARMTTIVGGAGGATAAGIAALTGSATTLVLASVFFVVAAIIAAGLPRPRTADEIDQEQHLSDVAEFDDVHRPLISVSASAYTVIRFAVGAFVFGLAFALRRANEPAWMYGAAVVGYGVGAYVGNVVAPWARRRFTEDRLLAAALVGLAVAAAFAAAGGSRILVIFVSFIMGMATTFGRQGFDSMVQRHAPLALHGRAFSRFETQFQLGWVFGAAFATGVSAPTQISLAVSAGVLIPASVFYLRTVREARRNDPTEATTVIVAVEQHLASVERWLEHERPNLAAVELAAAVDLLAADRYGDPVDPAALVEVTALRSDALVDGVSVERVRDVLQRVRRDTVA